MENLVADRDSNKMVDKEQVLSTILAFRGVDGFAEIDQAYEVIRSELPEGVEKNEILAMAKQVIVNQRPLSVLDNTVLLTEKGVILLTGIGSSYLLIIAGYEKSVDVTKLIDLLELL
jgi:hypothetical protein